MRLRNTPGNVMIGAADVDDLVVPDIPLTLSVISRTALLAIAAILFRAEDYGTDLANYSNHSAHPSLEAFRCATGSYHLLIYTMYVVFRLE